eukprot:scaffold71_cov247-Pinguiococcus_pyrenoidosus.AAC.15
MVVVCMWRSSWLLMLRARGQPMAQRWDRLRSRLSRSVERSFDLYLAASLMQSTHTLAAKAVAKLS